MSASADPAGPAGPDFTGPGRAGPDLAGPDLAGPDLAGPDLAGPDLAGRLERLVLGGLVPGRAGGRVREARLLGAQHGSSHYRVTLTDGRVMFAKTAAGHLGRALQAEARGLQWLGEAGAVAVSEVLGVDPALLVLAWIPEQRPDRPAAEQFGRDLAALHAAGAERFGSPWPGFIASLPLGDQAGDVSGVGEAWSDWYGRQRLLPYLRRAADAGDLTPGDTQLVEAVIGRLGGLAGPEEPPSRIHGDLWSGNVLWSGGRAWLIDPAAQGGHRETDLAMLALFGAPNLDRIMACYQETAPLADGWRARVSLHQMHPLLVHVCLFGGSYRGALLDAARTALSGQL